MFIAWEIILNTASTYRRQHKITQKVFFAENNVTAVFGRQS